MNDRISYQAVEDEVELWADFVDSIQMVNIENENFAILFCDNRHLHNGSSKNDVTDSLVIFRLHRAFNEFGQA